MKNFFTATTTMTLMFLALLGLTVSSVVYTSLIKPELEDISKSYPPYEDALQDWAKNNGDHPCYKPFLFPEKKSFGAQELCNEAAAKQAFDFLKDKRGLEAQEGMLQVTTKLFKLTAYQLIGVIASLVLSALALLVVIFTLKATQDAVIETKKQTILSFKPYFKITITGLYVSRDETSEVNNSIVFEIENIGKSPAFNVSPVIISDCFLRENFGGIHGNKFCQYEADHSKIIISPNEKIKFTINGHFEDINDDEFFNRYSGRSGSFFALNDSGSFSYRFNGSFNYEDNESVKLLKTCRFAASLGWPIGRDKVLTSFDDNQPIARVVSYESEIVKDPIKS